jgi:hypothetical protein
VIRHGPRPSARYTAPRFSQGSHNARNLAGHRLAQQQGLPVSPLPSRHRGRPVFRADWRISELIRHARTCGAPDPGVVCADDGPDFAALQAQVRGALKLEPRKEPDLARKRGRALCNNCAAQN